MWTLQLLTLSYKMHNFVRVSRFKVCFRGFHNTKVPSKLSCSRKLTLTSCIIHKLLLRTAVMTEDVVSISPSGYTRKRFFSSMKDDEQVKLWLKEIREDFTIDQIKENSGDKNVEELQDNYVKSCSGEDESLDKLHKDVEDSLENMEKLGFTTDEIIKLLKQMEQSNNNAADETSEDEENLSDSDSESDNNQQKDQPERGKDATGGKTEVHKPDTEKMTQEDWAVVVLRNPGDETDKKHNAVTKSEENIQDMADWSAVEIEDFVNIAEVEEEVESWQPPVDLVRGKTGVFDVEELVQVIRAANAKDVVTVRIPEEYNFADYMVIATAKSQRHMAAISGDVKWIYKRKKWQSDRNCKLEGEKTDWCAMDLGNIFLHIFMPTAREMYDLETLWTVGAKFDPKCVQEKDPFVFTVDELPWLKELEQASKDIDDKKEASGNPEQRKTRVDNSSIRNRRTVN